MKIPFLSQLEKISFQNWKVFGIPPAMQHTEVLKRNDKIVQRYLLFGILGGLEEAYSQYKKQTQVICGMCFNRK